MVGLCLLRDCRWIFFYFFFNDRDETQFPCRQASLFSTGWLIGPNATSWNIEVSEFEFEFHSVLATEEPPLLSVCLVQCLCATLGTCSWKTSSCALCRARTCIYTLTSMIQCPCSTRSGLATGKPLLLNVCAPCSPALHSLPATGKPPHLGVCPVQRLWL